jgi:hypothetical protein
MLQPSFIDVKARRRAEEVYYMFYYAWMWLVISYITYLQL